MKVYHASPIHNIKKLYHKSYVTIYPHIAHFMGLYYTSSGKPWNDEDLKEPYQFSDKIHFKPGRKPDGIPTLYVSEIEPNNIVLHQNFPFEFTIKKGVKCEKIPEKEVESLLKKSKKYLKLTDEILF